MDHNISLVAHYIPTEDDIVQLRTRCVWQNFDQFHPDGDVFAISWSLRMEHRLL